MSLVFSLELDSGQTVPVPVHLNDTFLTFLSRASKLIEKDVDISSIVGDKNVSLTDNIYQFMVREVLNNNSGQPSDISHDVVHIPDYNELMEKCILESQCHNDGDKKDRDHVIKQTPKILNLEYYNKRETEKTKDNKLKNDPRNSNNKCCFCGIYVTSGKFVSYIFNENDQKEMRKSNHRRNRGAAKVVCDHCLENDFIKYDEIPKNFDSDTFLIIKNNVQYFYKTKFPEKHRSVKILNASDVNVDGNDPKLDVKKNDKGSYEITKTKYASVIQQTIFYTCRLCKAVMDTLPLSHCLDHVSSRAAGLVFPCVLCEYGFTAYVQLRDHMSSVHSIDRTMRPVTSENDDKGLKLLKELLNKQREKREEEWLDEDTGVMRNNVVADESVPVDAPETDAPPSKESESDSESGVWIIQAADDSHDDNAASTRETECDNEEDDVIQYQCDTCSGEFDSMESFNAHGCVTQYLNAISVVLVEGDGAECDQPPEEVKATVIAVSDSGAKKEVEAKEIEGVEESGQHKCQSCMKSFHTKIRLQFHIRYIHSAGSDPSSLRCSICPDLMFNSESALYDHIHFTHPKNKKYMCPVEGCDKQFHIKGVLNNHLGCHTGERTHACDTCNKQFFDRQTLNEHKVTHLKVKPFQCHICQKYLNRKSRLRMHLLNHQSQPTCSPVLACKSCNAAFSSVTAAEEHLNQLGHCTSTLDWESSGSQNNTTEESVDDPDIVESPNDSGIDLKLDADQQTDAKQGSCGLFEDSRIEDEAVDHNVTNISNEEKNLAPSVRIWNDDNLAALSDDARQTIVVVEVDKVFRCEYCEKTYWRQEALNIHRGEHQGQANPYACHICKARFSTYSRCTTHKTTHGLYRENTFKSELPASKSTRDDALPVVKHFLCEVCNKSYLHWTYLQVHRRLKHSDNVHMYKCLTCGDEFPNSWGVAYHRKKVHGQSSGSAPADEVPDSSSERMVYSCPDCGLILPTKAQLFLHKRSAHPNPPSPPKADLFACSRCNKRYITKTGLQGHFKKQHEKSSTSQIHKCDECKKTFINVSGLNTHIRRVHMKEIKFKCMECGLGFYSSCDLRSHLRRHSGERPFPCHLCGKHFRTKGMRNQHVRIHSGERPYRCDICGVGFRRSYALRSHRLTHAPHTRSIPCPICPRLFRLKAELNTHMRHMHCVDPLTYTATNLSNQAETAANTAHVLPKTISNDDEKKDIIICENPMDVVNENIADDIKDEKTLILNVHQNSNVDSCLFTTYFEDGQHNFIDNMEEVQMSDPVFNQNNHEMTNQQQMIHSDTVMASSAQLVSQDDVSSNNLCVLSGQSLPNGDIILDANMLPSSQYVLDENIQIIGELSEETRNLLFGESSGHNRVLEINGYNTKLVMLNNVVDVNDIKLININNDLVNKQVDELTSDNLNDLYGSGVVIDKVSINADMSIDDDVIDRGGSFVIDWQENEDVASNEKSLDNCKYFSDTV